MIDKNTIIKITNRDNGSVGYSVPDLGINHREFMPGETKEITVEELRKLSYLPGGKYMIKHLFIIDNEEVIEELIPDVEQEYFYTAEDVKYLLTKGSVDQLLDCLDFAPIGVIELVKSLAVELEIDSETKRNAIFEKTGYNIDTAIKNKRLSQIENDDAHAEAPKRRAAAINTKSETTERRTSTTVKKYNVVGE